MTRIITLFFFTICTLMCNFIYAQQCKFVQVSSKSGHSFGISAEGKLYAWGSNSQAQLGLGTKTISEPTPTLVSQDTGWKKVETGNSCFFSAGLKNNGSLWLWGDNVYDILGNQTDLLVPTHTAQNMSWKDFSTGFFRILAIRDDNTLWGWGNNEGGSLGIDSTRFTISIPTQVGSDNNWSKISCGLNHTLALKSNGTVWVCGSNNVGQHGNGTSMNGFFSDKFIQVGTDNNWTEILAGAAFNLAIKNDGTLWAWGNNQAGQLGDGTKINRLQPTQIGTDKDWKSLGYSGNSSAAIKTNGTLWTWGFGAQGQLGNGSKMSALVPTQIGSDTDWKIVSGGGGFGFAGTTGDHYLALKQNNELFSWGVNLNGALGNNSTDTIKTPSSICNTVNSDEFTNSRAIKVFPNPSNNIIHVESESHIINLILFNNLGQVVKQKANSNYIDISEFENGTYFLKIEMRDRIFDTKNITILK